MHKTHLNPTRSPSAALCHLPGTFFKDLQTNLPEIFRAQSGIHQSCFILPFFTKNRLNREMPQPTPATALTSVPKNFFRLLSPCNLSSPRPRSEPRASASGTRKAGCPIALIAKRRRNQCRRLYIPQTLWHVLVPPVSHQKPSQKRAAPTHVRHASCNRPKRSDSPYVTFGFSPPAPGHEAACRLATDHRPGPERADTLNVQPPFNARTSRTRFRAECLHCYWNSLPPGEPTRYDE